MLNTPQSAIPRQELSAIDSIDEWVWNDLHQQVSLARVHEVTSQIFARYSNAPIRGFIPLLVRRQAREVLRKI